MRTIILIFLIGTVYGAPAAPAAPDRGLCEVCHLLVGEVQDLLTTGQTQTVISNYVSNACNKLPSEEKDVCNSFLHDHSGTLFDRLVKDLTPSEVCERLTDVCPAYYEEPEVRPIEEADDPTANPLECELCKLAVLAIDKLIKQNRSSAAINDTLEKFCDGLPDKLKDVCRQVEPAILKGITTGFSPDIACKFATLCSVEGKDNSAHVPCDVCYTVMNAIGIADTESICASQTSCIRESEAQRKQEQTKPEVGDTLECQICKFAVQTIDTLVGENRTIVAINSTLINLCESLPGELKDSCLNVEPDILKAVIGGIDPSKACDFLKICNDENKVPVSSLYIPCDVCKDALESVAGEKGVRQCYKFKDVCGLEEPQPQAEEKIETPYCELCQFLVKSVSDLVQTDRSRDTVAALLDYICTPLPEEAKLFCTNHRTNIIEQVVTGVSHPKQSCEDIDVCKEYEKDIFYFEEVEKESVTVRDDAKCELCKFVIQLLDETVESNSTIAQINATLIAICNALPDTYKQLCVSIVPQIETAIAAGLDPTNTCIASNFCTPTTRLVSIEDLKCQTCARFVESLPDAAAIKVKNGACSGACRTRSRRSAENESPLLYKMKELVKATNLKGVAECELCHIFIRTLDGLAGENASIETVNKTVIEICTRLTGIQLQTVCLKEAPVLTKLLKDGLDPVKTCIDAKMCTQVEIKKRSVVEEAEGEEGIKDVDDEFLRILKQKTQENVGDLECDICEGVVELLDKLVEENATDEMINQTLYKLCSGLPDGALKDLCVQEAPAILAAVENGFDPQKTCELAQLCSGVNKLKERAHPKTIKKLGKSTDTDDVDSALLETIVSKQRAQHNVGDLPCDICEGVVELLDSVLENNATDEQINQTLNKLCTGLPDGALKDLCLQEVPVIMQTIEQGFDPQQTCQLAGLCSGNQRSRKMKSKKALKRIQETVAAKDVLTEQKQPEPSENLGNLKDLKCDVCKAIIEELDTVIKQNASAEKINETVYELCATLQGALQDLCLQAAPQIVDVLANGVDPTQACAAVGLCSGISEKTVADIRKWDELTDDVGDAKCDICKVLVKGLDEILGMNSTEQKINETIYMLCNDLSGSAQRFCLLVAPTIVATVEGGVAPEIACDALKLCTTTEQPEVMENVGDIKCEICELIIGEIDTLVGENATDEKINATIYSICSKLPGTANKYCVMVAPTIVKAVESGVNPEEACAALKLCTSLEVMENVGDIKCEICELIIGEIDTLVGENATDEKINATIYSICSKLPGTANKYCVMVAPTIVKAVESGVNPEEACAALKLCTSLDENPASNSITEVRKDPLDCNICIRSLEAAYEDVSGDYMKVQRQLRKLCSNLPVAFRNPCERLVQNDHGKLYKMVIKNYSPTSLCEMAKCQEIEEPLKNGSS